MRVYSANGENWHEDFDRARDDIYPEPQPGDEVTMYEGELGDYEIADGGHFTYQQEKYIKSVKYIVKDIGDEWEFQKI